jgi:general secretion pathway protein J
MPTALVMASVPRRPPCPWRNQHGFTLLEMLVALAVLGLLLALLGDGVRLGLQTWQAQVRTVAARGDLDAVDRLLRRLVAGMDPGSTTVAPLVLGAPDRLAFTAVLPEGAYAGPPAPVDIALGVDAAHWLVLRWTPHRHEPHVGLPPPVREVRLLPGIAGIELAYWPRTPPFEWRTAWAGPALPGLVRIRLRFAAVGRPAWPDIAAAPMRDPRNG